MKNKAISFLIMTALLFSVMGVVSADTTYIAGKIYNADYSATINGATVNVTCNGNLLSTTSQNDGAYSVSYDESVCSQGSSLSVHAVKEGVGENTIIGTIHNDYPAVNVNLGVVNVPLVPEFGAIVASLTVLGALGAFFVVRRKN